LLGEGQVASEWYQSLGKEVLFVKVAERKKHIENATQKREAIT
jgi:hypothetical protein